MRVFLAKAGAWLVLVWLVSGSAGAEALRWTVHPILQDGTNVSARPYDLAFGNGRFVGIDSRNTFIAREAEPHVWTRGTTIADADLHKIIFGNGLFVAAGQDTKSQTGLLVTSTDGAEWSRHAFEGAPRMVVAHGNGRFVAVGEDLVAISTNGVEWSVRTNVVQAPLYLRWIDFANGEFFAAVQTGFPAAHPCSKLATSRDGVNWELHEAFCGEFVGEMAYGRNAYVLLGLNDCCGSLYLSPDGRSWRQEEYPVPFVGSAIAYANGFFAIAGHSGYFLSSIDGRSWEAFRLQSSMLFSGITFGPGRFVGIGSTWNDGRAMAAVSEIVGPPRLITDVRLREGGIEVQFETDEQREWFVEASENLVDWTVVRQVEVTVPGVQSAAVPVRPGAGRFFRLR